MSALWLMPLSLVCGLVLDRWLGEPKHGHPLVGFGRLAGLLEGALNRPGAEGGRARGALALTALVLPVLALTIWLCEWADQHSLWQFVVGAVALYLAVGWQSLEAHIEPIVGRFKAAAPGPGPAGDGLNCQSRLPGFECRGGGAGRHRIAAGKHL